MLALYRVPDNHRTVTLRGGHELLGSVHHPELAVFTGLVTQRHEDGSADLIIFPPKRNPVHVENVREGAGPGTFTALAAAAAGPDLLPGVLAPRE